MFVAKSIALISLSVSSPCEAQPDIAKVAFSGEASDLEARDTGECSCVRRLRAADTYSESRKLSLLRHP